MRAGRSTSGPSVAVVYPGSTVRLELTLAREVLCRGTWDLEVRCDGQAVEPKGSWAETCWYRDTDVEYLELQLQCSGGVCVERHVLLARKDRFAVLADAVLSRRRAKIEYRGSVPLADRVAYKGMRQTREGTVRGRSARALVLPLALPEWRCDPRPGGFGQMGRRLELRQSGEGGCLFAPLLIDLDPRRRAKPRTWRRLTVAQDLRVQPPHVAVGFRVQIGRQQWLVYRALATKGNRTLLGHNLSSEFLAARFLRGGKVEPLLEIE